MARIIKQYIRYVPAEITTFTPMIGGLTPASGASSPETKFLRGDATWTTLSSTILSDFTESVQDVVGSQLVAGTNVTINYDDSTGQITISSSGGGGISDGDKGDITVSSSGSVWNIDAGVVTTTELGGDITTAGKALLDDADAAAQRTTLGLGTAATSNTGDFAAASHTHIIGDITSLQTALDNKLDDSQLSAFGGTLIDDVDASAARTTLGLGTLATQSGTFSGTSSGTNTGDQNLFSTISVSGQSDVVADTSSDTLTLVAGSNITITTNAGTDSITIAGTGGGTLGDADYGDITVSGSGTVMTIDNDVVTYAKIQNVSATDRLLGRVTSGAGDIEEVTFTDFAQSLVDDVDASAARTTLGLGTLATQSGTFSGTSSGTNTGDQTITLTSDVTGSGTGSFATTIAAGAVSLSKMANMATASILGRNTAGTGSPEVLSATTTKTLLSLNNVENTAISTWAGTTNITTVGTISTGTWSGTTIGLSKGGTGASLSAPASDKILFYDQSAGSMDFLTLGTNLSITGTTLNASGGGGGLSDGDYGDIVVSGTGTVMTIDSSADVEVNTLGIGGSVSGSNVLVTNGDVLHDANGSGDCNLSLNKDTTGDSAQFFFNNNYSTRGIVGLQGDDDLTFKVSPDGSTFHSGIVIDKDDGSVTFPNGATVDIDDINATGTPSSSTYLRGDGAWTTVSGGSDPWTYVVLNSDFNTTSTSSVTITGMSMTPSSSTYYEFECRFFIKSGDTTVGCQVGVSQPSAGVTSCAWYASVPISSATSGTYTFGAGTAKSTSSSVPSTTVFYLAYMHGLLNMTTGASGTLDITVAAETASGTTIGAGSYFKYRSIS